MTTGNMKTIHHYDTIYNADSVEFCPIDPHQDVFVCGTYQNIDEKRIGSILLFRISKDKLEELGKVDSPAILDLKWCPRRIQGNILLGAANAAGEVCIYKLDNGLTLLEKINLNKDNDNNFLALSLDWNKSEDEICGSDSKGNITVLKLADNYINVVNEWNGHSLEAWIVCFDSFRQDVVYSGGDDGKLRVWSTDSSPITTSTKHTAGVTTFHSNPYEPNLLASGSYDENIFLWDSRNFKSPKSIIPGCGGIWRLKWEPKKRSKYLLSASVYGGFQIFNVNDCSKVADYREHESLAYGADWCYKNIFDSPNLSLISTCSFYDHKLCVSIWDESL